MIKLLYAPWRSLYQRLKSTKKTLSNNCPFCSHAQSENDKENYVIRRFTHTMILLNLYPYNAGHLLIIPYDHKSTLEELDNATRTELIEVASLSSRVLKKELHCSGLNLGINIGGQAAGGSIPEHLHLHVVPRFNGDTNFLAAIADTKLISQDLRALYKKLVIAFSEH